MPRFLARLPYDPKTNPVEDFVFQEETDGKDHDKYVWANSAYAMAANVTQSFKQFGWCTSIRGIENGGQVEGLPVHTFQSSDGGVDMKCPTEVSIDFRLENQLSKAGLLPLIHERNSDRAVFIGGQSLQKPKEYTKPEATANAALAAGLTYLFATCRFAHYLQKMTVRKLGSNMEGPDLERYLSDWIKDYVLEDPQNHGPEMKARKPLAGAELEVKPIEGRPGAYAAKFRLRPHYQLESVKIDLSLVSKIQRAA
jgi:type VI secretion system protein ImpC